MFKRMSRGFRSWKFSGAVGFIVKTAEMNNRSVIKLIATHQNNSEKMYENNEKNLVLLISLSLFSFLQGAFKTLPSNSHQFIVDELVHQVSIYRDYGLKTLALGEIEDSIKENLAWFGGLIWTKPPVKEESIKGNAFWEIAKVIMNNYDLAPGFVSNIAIGGLLAKMTSHICRDGEEITEGYKEIWLKLSEKT